MSVNSAFKKLVEAEQAILRALRDAELHHKEARYMVDLYYSMQEFRKSAANQIRAMEAEGEKVSVMPFILKYCEGLEDLIKAKLEPYVRDTYPGRWMLAQLGIGPVLAANMLAHLDITRAPTAGAFWKFAGLVPNLSWGKGEKRPYNAKLKTACWKLGDSLVKLGTREDAFYAQIYRKRKALEVEKNERGELADRAKEALEKKKFRDDTKAKACYEAGRLPPAHLDMRARRYAVKLFLSHLHWVMYVDHYKADPPNPYPIEHMGHAHIIRPPSIDAAA